MRECLGVACLAGFATLSLGRPPLGPALLVALIALTGALGWLAGYRRNRRQAAINVELLIAGAAAGGLVTAYLAAAVTSDPLTPRELAGAAFEPGVAVVGLAMGEDIARRIHARFSGGVFPPP